LLAVKTLATRQYRQTLPRSVRASLNLKLEALKDTSNETLCFEEWVISCQAFETGIAMFGDHYTILLPRLNAILDKVQEGILVIQETQSETDV
jgi:hypothetical protein